MPAPLVALLYEGHVRGSHEAFCRAFAAAANARGWRVHLCGNPPEGLTRAEELGAVAAVGPCGRPDLAAAAAASPLPVINVYGGGRLAGLLQVGISDRATGKLAAQAALDLGHRHLAYLGFCAGDDDESVDRQRYAGIRDAVAGTGASLQRAAIRSGGLDAWLGELPDPVAVICVDDRPAADLALRAERLGLAVPGRLGLLGINNHHLICELAHPPLASVELGTERLGPIAGELLARRLAGQRIERPVELLQPLRVHLRASLGLSAALPTPVREAIELINRGAWRDNDPTAVARAVGRNRRVLDNLFREYLGDTVFARIRQRLVAEIQRYLADPDRSVAAISRELGFSSPSYLGRIFRTVTGMTPEQWRRGEW